jgi:serine/threonine-protein kinase
VLAHLQADEIIDGKYRIVRFLGQGAWASVYEGINVRIQRRVAIKVLSPDLAEKDHVIERFEREAQSATRIESDHVVNVFDLGSLKDGRPYIVMELLAGDDLAKRLELTGPMKEGVAANYAVQALQGLADAHAAGVLHRDIKPDNIVLTQSKRGEEVVKIVDFGISKLQSGLPQAATRLTQTNTVLGSPVYMSPEQCRGTREMDHRSDLYSLGVVLFETLTGRLPHMASSFNELLFQIALEDAPDPRTMKHDLDPGLAAIVVRALARDPKARFQSASEFRDTLVAWAEGKGLMLGPLTTSSTVKRSPVAPDNLALQVAPTVRPVADEGSLASIATSVERPRDLVTTTPEAEGAAASMSAAWRRKATMRKGLLVGGAIALLLAGGLIVPMLSGAGGAPPSASASREPAGTKAEVPASAAPSSATVATPVVAPPGETGEAAEAASASASVGAAPSSSPGARAPQRVADPRERRLPTNGQPPAVASSGAVTATAPVASAAPAASTKSVVDGRTIRVTF